MVAFSQPWASGDDYWSPGLIDEGNAIVNSPQSGVGFSHHKVSEDLPNNPTFSEPEVLQEMKALGVCQYFSLTCNFKGTMALK